ncbi:hypothetical protein HRbin16_03194 [bacterium HR16]|nr:hypothetical protein HRbin16_03194 [bacterium HR16]
MNVLQESYHKEGFKGFGAKNFRKFFLTPGTLAFLREVS